MADAPLESGDEHRWRKALAVATTQHPAVWVRHDDADDLARKSLGSSNFRDCVFHIIDEYLLLGACF